MEPHIKKVKDKIYKLYNKLDLYKTTLEHLQEICKHKWTYIGHGHNDSFYECTKCGAEKSE